MDPKDVIHLLVEIRDIQREHLEEYRRVTNEALELQRRAVQRQEQFARLYRLVLVVGAILLAGAIILLLHLLRILRF